MAPKTADKKADKKAVVKRPSAADAEKAAQYEKARAAYRRTAVLQFTYILGRTLWHYGLPQLFGVQQYVPLVLEVFMAELVLFVLFWVAGGLGPKSKERDFLLNIYNIVSIIVLAKCITDCYVYSFAPHMWGHYSPLRPWGVPKLLAGRLPDFLLARGVQPEAAFKAFEGFEKITDMLCLLFSFMGVRQGKLLMVARREQRRALAQKKED